MANKKSPQWELRAFSQHTFSISPRQGQNNFQGTHMIMKTPRVGNEKHDADYYVWLGPYLRTRAVSDDQFTLALASGLTIDECHDRLLDAECLLSETYDDVSWAQGWQDAVIAIEWLDSDENRRDEDTELFYGDLRELADDRRQELRRGCYSASLITGTPELDEIVYSNTLGRCNCLSAGMWFVRDEHNDYCEIASVLRSTTDTKELRELAARQREDDYLNSRSRINGLLNVLGSLQAIGGAK